MSNISFTLLDSYLPSDNDLLLFPFSDEKEEIFLRKVWDKRILEAISVSKEEGGKITFFAGYLDEKRLTAESVRLDAKGFSKEQQLKSAVSSAADRARKEMGAARIVLSLEYEDVNLLSAIQEGAEVGGYFFDKYLENKKEDISVCVIVRKEKLSSLKPAVERNAIIFKWVNYARDILNEPPNVIYPATLSEAFNKAVNGTGLQIEEWDETRLANEKCGGILAVGQGSHSHPRLIKAVWEPESYSKHIILVGKGVTFDTGGYCLKPASSQIGMKYDMGGAAMMFASACAIAQLKLSVKITLFTPLVENDISSKAYHTTDIITCRSGKTVQVDNTDAEGRLILADALSLASEEKPDLIIDSATLTGACVVALGEDIAGLFSRKKKIADDIILAGNAVGESLWEMPFYKPYMEQLKAEVADCKNIGGKWGGAITAALFLNQFVADDIPWVHMDIAGPAGKEESLNHIGNGAKGFGVKTMVRFIEEIGARKIEI